MQSISFFAICLLVGFVTAAPSAEVSPAATITTTNAASETVATNDTTPESVQPVINDDPNIADGAGKPTRISTIQETTTKPAPLIHDPKIDETTLKPTIASTSTSNTNTNGNKESTTTPASGKKNGNNGVSRVNAGFALFSVVLLLISGIIS